MPSETPVDPIEWLTANHDGFLAGVLAYEFAWELLDVRAPRPRSDTPRCWVGRFASRSRVSPRRYRGRAYISDFACRIDRAAYEQAVASCVNAIYSGELFEINYTARFEGRWPGTPSELFAALNATSAGDHFGLLESDELVVVSASPESFVEVRDGRVVSRPIKGTRARALDDPVEDERRRRDLVCSEKDRAENVMIVDLMRNDLTRVCELGTVQATSICELKTYPGVHHLVSTVEGTIRDDVTPMEVLLRCFPAGSITGAPKLRAIELAAALEHDARGPYTGSMFVASPDELVANVLIRTATVRERTERGIGVEYGAGGAIVADSDPAAEWGEALAKCAPLRRLTHD